MITCILARDPAPPLRKLKAPTSPQMLWTVPNILTWIRIAAIPLIILLFYAPYHWADPAAGLLFAAAGITDSLDGYLARRLNQTSRLGAFLDPVADKLVVAVALVLLLSKDVPAVFGVHAERVRVLLALTAIVIIGREIAISALREWMAELGQRGKVAVSAIGKYKTILQIIGLSMMLYRWDLLGLPIFSIGAALTVLAAAFTLVSMVSYLRAAWPELKRH
jgi:CDP-diacylglycerol--glycerol-3-phosphate 3-phosphatidyltransferase